MSRCKHGKGKRTSRSSRNREAAVSEDGTSLHRVHEPRPGPRRRCLCARAEGHTANSGGEDARHYRAVAELRKALRVRIPDCHQPNCDEAFGRIPADTFLLRTNPRVSGPCWRRRTTRVEVLSGGSLLAISECRAIHRRE